MFKGDVYSGIEVEDYSKTELNFANKHLRILSGLYGVLRPLDLMQPYRLEMGTKLKTERGKDLYEFWGAKISKKVNESLKKQKSKVLVNLASNEYYSAIKRDELEADVVTPVFKEVKNDKARVIALFAKRARGEMANFIVRNTITKPADLKKFKANGYRFLASESDADTFVFTRKQP